MAPNSFKIIVSVSVKMSDQVESEQLFTPALDKDKPVIRKFLAEAGVHLYSSGANVFRPSDLYNHGQDSNVRAALEGCNIYLICRRRRISIDPYTLSVSDGLLKGKFRLHGEDFFEFESHKFRQRECLTDQEGQPFRFISAKATNSTGFDVLARDGYGRSVMIPAHALIANSINDLPERSTSLEVLYVGLAYGKQGKRLAVDRLVDHTTLQRILAESAQRHPCDEVLLLFFRYEHAKNILSTAGDPSVEPTASSDEEQQHLFNSGHVKIDRRTRITLAEATLINYFKPQYNILHKESFRPFRMKRLKLLKRLFEHDLSALIVEINTSNMRAKLFSAHARLADRRPALDKKVIDRLQSKSWLEENGIGTAEAEQYAADMTHAHIAAFPLYEKSERETFLHELPWNE
jgi:hypothetical protein